MSSPIKPITPGTLTGPQVNGNGNQANQTDGTSRGLKLPNRSPLSGSGQNQGHHHTHFRHADHHHHAHHQAHHQGLTDHDRIHLLDHLTKNATLAE